MKLPKCKITIIKRTLNKELIEDFIIDEYKQIGPCELFKNGAEIIIDPNMAKVPENFCDWAWADIRQTINLVASGGNIIGMKESGTAIATCSDWSRPVYFKIERLE